MTRYLVELEANGRRTETYRDASSPEDAAAQAARGWYLDARVEPRNEGTDLYGAYIAFTARTSYTRIPASVRVRWTR